MKTIINIILWLVISCGWLSLGFLTGWVVRVRLHENTPPKLPTIMEIQERIGANPDGRLGPETQAKWDKAICNQYAIETFKGMEKK